MGVLVSDGIEKGIPAMCELIMHLLDSELSISLSLDPLPYMLFCHCCFNTIVGTKAGETGHSSHCSCSVSPWSN
jgi:hypothetical protein